MESPYEISPGVHILPSHVPVPGMGLVPANAYLVKGAQPYLVDTGLLSDTQAFLAALEALIDLRDLRWIYLTHDDADHIGSLLPLLARAPHLKVVTSFLALGKLGLWQMALPPGQTWFLNPGEELDLGDRTLTPIRPPLFDSPATTAVYDDTLDALFSADSFGCPLDQLVAFADEIAPGELARRQAQWASFDAPWIHHVDRAYYAQQLDTIARRAPRWILSSHLPPARFMADPLCDNLRKAADAPPYVGPTQREFEALMAALAPTPPTAPAPP